MGEFIKTSTLFLLLSLFVSFPHSTSINLDLFPAFTPLSLIVLLPCSHLWPCLPRASLSLFYFISPPPTRLPPLPHTNLLNLHPSSPSSSVFAFHYLRFCFSSTFTLSFILILHRPFWPYYISTRPPAYCIIISILLSLPSLSLHQCLLWFLSISSLPPSLCGRGVVRVDVNLQDVDIDQCSTSGWFAGTHRCNLTSMEVSQLWISIDWKATENLLISRHHFQSPGISVRRSR